jgi:hypothetical protein
MSQVFVGVDPGLHGAMAVLDQAGAFCAVVDAPTSTVAVMRTRQIKDAAGVVTGKRAKRGEKTVLVPLAMGAILQGVRDTGAIGLVAIEEVGTRPGESPIAAYSFGFGRGLWVMAAVMLECPLIEPRPQEWKGFLKLPADKEAVRLRALKRWPAAAQSLARKKDEGRAEALFLAEFARLTQLGTARREAL